MKRNGLDVVSFLKHFNYSFHILLYAMCFYMKRKLYFILFNIGEEKETLVQYELQLSAIVFEKVILCCLVMAQT